MTSHSDRQIVWVFWGSSPPSFLCFATMITQNAADQLFWAGVHPWQNRLVEPLLFVFFSSGEHCSGEHYVFVPPLLGNTIWRTVYLFVLFLFLFSFFSVPKHWCNLNSQPVVAPWFAPRSELETLALKMGSGYHWVRPKRFKQFASFGWPQSICMLVAGRPKKNRKSTWFINMGPFLASFTFSTKIAWLMGQHCL